MTCPGAALTDAEELEIISELQTQLEEPPKSPGLVSEKKQNVCATPGPVRRLDSFGATPGSSHGLAPMDLSTPAPSEQKVTPVKLLSFDEDNAGGGGDAAAGRTAQSAAGSEDSWSSWDDNTWWGQSRWMPRSWSSCSWEDDWGYDPKKQWLT